MLTYDEHIILKRKLISGEVSAKEAKEFYWKNFKEGKRSWHTKDWKERRLKVLKDKCEICDGKDTLTIQHLSHPKKPSDYKREVIRKYTQVFKDTNATIDKNEFKKHIIKHYNYIPVPLCPNCGDNRPYKRVRKLPQYRCVECKYEFDKPLYKSLDELIGIFYKNEDALDVRDKCFISKDKWNNKHNLSNIRYWLQREIAKTKNEEKIEKEAFLLYLDANIKYLSFEDTITACRRCASNYDLNNMDLCPKCKEHYKDIQYPTCIQCLPENKRKTIEEMIEFGKEWQSIHKKLGID